MKSCVEEIEKLYKKEVNAWLKEAGIRIASDVLDVGISAFENEIPVLNVIGKIRDGIDKFGEITGSGDRAKSMLNALIYQDIYYSSKSAYENALDNVKSADPDDENYNQLINDLKNCFDFCKKNLVNLLNEMANSTQGSKKAYYQYCMTVASKASLNDTKKLEIMSYNDYISYGV
jgi:hypothetical protein